MDILEQRKELTLKYIPMMAYYPYSTSIIMVDHQLLIRRAAALKAVMDMYHMKRANLELKKPFVIAYWNTFGRGF